MERKILIPIVSIASVILLTFGFTESEIDIKSILKKAEYKRVPWDGMSIDASITNEGKDDKHTYKVFYQGEKTLVAFVEPVEEKGNLLLMNGNDLWFYINGTNRPTRITPIQRLSGAASYGDLTRLGWSEDYDVVKMIDTTETVNSVDTAVYKFDLKSKSPSATYQKIQLWVNKSNFRPIRSEVYLTSGKLYKTLDFGNYITVSGKEVNAQITFTDHFNKDKKSVLNFSNFSEEKNLPNRYFIKTMLPEVSDELAD